MFNQKPTNLEELQPILFATAYKMIGEIQASEDIAQETLAIYLQKLAQKSLGDIKNLKSYLIKTAINRSINYLKKIKKERENYYGVWLPEPIINYDEVFDAQLDVGYGVTFLLSRLNPKERAIFILKNAFDFSFKEIAEAIQLKEVTCRKNFQRLQKKLTRKTNLDEVAKKQKERFLNAFLAVGESGDLTSFINFLKEDMVIYSDGGGKATAAKIPLMGIETCLKFLLGIYQKTKNELVGELVIINGEPALFLKNKNGNLETVMLFDVMDGQISDFYFIRNPDKLKMN